MKISNSVMNAHSKTSDGNIYIYIYNETGVRKKGGLCGWISKSSYPVYKTGRSNVVLVLCLSLNGSSLWCEQMLRCFVRVVGVLWDADG